MKGSSFKRFLRKQRARRIKYGWKPNCKNRFAIPGYKEWRLEVLKIFDNRCVECGSINKLHVHHKREWAKNIKLRLDVANGQVLCFECHKKKHPFMKSYYK